MRKTAALGLLLTFALAGVSPLSAQRTNGSSVKPRFTRTNEFDGVRAITDGDGVLVRWQMKSEAAVAGYNVYRVNGETKELANRSIVTDAFMRMGPASYGETHQFFDLDGRAGGRYVVEGLRFDGSSFVSGAVVTEAVKSVEAEAGTSSQDLRTAALSNNSNVESRTPILSRALADVVSSYSQQPDPEAQRSIASKPGAKIAVKNDGFCRVTAAQLAEAGFAVASDSSKWRLFTNGVEQAINVGPNGAYVEFYGRGIDAPETDTRIYYLVADTVPGKRIATRFLRSVPGSPAARSYPLTATKKERVEFNPELFNGDEDNFLGLSFASNGHSVNFGLTGVDFSVPEATVRLSFFGVDNQIVGYTHEVHAKINGHELLPIIHTGHELFSKELQIPTSYLVEGQNVLEMAGSSAADYLQLDKIDVTYKRTYTADGAKLSFASPGSKKFEITGFPSDTVRVFDVTFEGAPVQLTGLPVTEGSAGYSVQVPATRAMVGYAVDDAALLSPVAVTANAPSALATAGRTGSDMLIITAPEFRRASDSWATYRRSGAGGGLSVEVVDVTDVFDEFNYGMVGSASIKGLLDYASSHWTAAPKFVLLVGDSSFDPRNYENIPGNINYMPAHFVQLSNEEAPSDDWFADFDNDGFASIAIGRISARTPVQVATALSKTVAYEANQLDFARGALFAHANDPEFEAMSQTLSRQLPDGTPVTVVDSAETNASANLVNAMNQGNFIVNYSGHGATGVWTSSDFFSITTVPQLTNAARPSVYSMLTCSNGYFVRPNSQVLSEALLFSETGGAAASWGSTSQSTSDFQLFMAERFFNDISTGRNKRLGNLIMDAKLVISAGADVRLSWVLIGDPALRMP